MFLAVVVGSVSRLSIIAYTFIMHRIFLDVYIKEIAKFTSGTQHLGSEQEIHYFSVSVPFYL